MAAEKAQLTAASTISWSGGTPFNGYVLLIMALPSSSGAAWTRVTLRDTRPVLRLPARIKVPIREGIYDPSTPIWRTDSLTPVNIKYASFFYDDTDRLIAVGPSLFDVAASEYTLAPPTLTDPTASITAPDPEDVPSSQITTIIHGAPDEEDLVGTKNGINTAFTISRDAAVAVIMYNGIVLDEGLGYTRSGVNITTTAAPDADESLRAILW